MSRLAASSTCRTTSPTSPAGATGSSRRTAARRISTAPRNNDIWACLDDGSDDDTLSDGCIRIATLNDLDAEMTGGFFDPTGQHYYVSIQHNSSGAGIVLDVTGWR